MKQILVYGDSLSWGIIPGTRQRLSFDMRWAGVMEQALTRQNKNVRVIENCLNGRRTVWPDPFKDGRDGSAGLSEVMEINSPLELVIFMLGTNDFQCTHNNNAYLSAQGMLKLINITRQAPIEPGMPEPQLLIAAPPVIKQPQGEIAGKFNGAEKRCSGLADKLAEIAKQNNTLFFDTNSVISASEIDGIHLDKPQHLTLGEAMASYLLKEEDLNLD